MDMFVSLLILLLELAASFDIWSFACILFFFFAGTPLLKSDAADNISPKLLPLLADWNLESLFDCLALLVQTMTSNNFDLETILQVKDFLTWMLQPNPLYRPQSFADVCKSFFGDFPS